MGMMVHSLNQGLSIVRHWSGVFNASRQPTGALKEGPPLTGHACPDGTTMSRWDTWVSRVSCRLRCQWLSGVTGGALEG